MGAAFVYFKFNELSKLRAGIDDRNYRIQAARIDGLAPTVENLKLSKADVSKFSKKLAELRANLNKGVELSASEDSIGVMIGIQQHIAAFRAAVVKHRKAGEGGAVEIAVPDDFGFGFDQYVAATNISEQVQFISILDKQRKVLEYTLDKLMSAHPRSIESVFRERPQEVMKLRNHSSSNGQRGSFQSRRVSSVENQEFQLEAPLSARVPGAINTLAFSITFTSYTETLRRFLNGLAQSEFPLVVRSVEVMRPNIENVTLVSAGDDFDVATEVFGLGGGASEHKPVVEENVSRFTVIFEYLEIVAADLAEDELYESARVSEIQESSTVWPKAMEQAPGVLYDVFTPPKIYLNQRGEFVFEGIRNTPDQWPIYLAEISRRPYRIQLEGYIEESKSDGSKNLLLLYDVERGKSLRVRVGDDDGLSEILVERFIVERVGDVAKGTFRKTARATILDKRTGRRVVLTEGEPQYDDAPILVIRSDRDGAFHIELSMAGDEFMEGEATYVLKAINLKELSAVVEKVGSEKEKGSSFKTLTIRSNETLKNKSVKVVPLKLPIDQS